MRSIACREYSRRQHHYSEPAPAERIIILPVREKRESVAEPICEDAPRPRYKPGVYDLYCTSANYYRDPQFRTHKAVLRFNIMGREDQVLMFLNLGDEEKPKAGLRSNYRRAWIMANGTAPKKRQTMSVKIFKDKLFKGRIADVVKRHDGLNHAEGDVYSVVSELLEKVN